MNSLIRKEGRKGFTLVEIMIVVVIIGLLAAMAIPGFQRVRQNSVHSTMDNDARQIASAAQQYFLETGDVSVAVDDLIGDGDDKYMPALSRQVEVVDESIAIDENFSLRHPQASENREYNPQGVYID